MSIDGVCESVGVRVETTRFDATSCFPHSLIIYIHIEGIWQMLLSKATYKEYICRRRDSNISLWYIKIRIEQV